MTGSKTTKRVCFVATFASEPKGAKARAAIVRTGKFHYKGRDLNITKTRLDKLKANFERFDRAGEIPLDYEHGTAIGQTVDERKSAGWLLSVSVGPDPNRDGEWILWGDFKLTPPAKKYVENDEFKFLSIEFDQDYFHPEAQEDVGDYLQAVALTNRPFVEKLPGMVLMSKETAEQIESLEGETAGEGRAARGSDSPTTGARADGEGEGLMKINLTQLGGPAEATEEEAKTCFSAHAAKLTKAEADAKAEKARADKAEADAKVALSKVDMADADKKVLLGRIDSLEQKDAEREFGRIFDAAKTDPQGARAVEAERGFLQGVYLSHATAGKVGEFEKWMSDRPRILATRPAGSGAVGGAPETSAEAKFLAAVAVKRSADKISFTQAARAVAKENPALEAAYMAEQRAKVTLNRGAASGPPSGEVV